MQSLPPKNLEAEQAVLGAMLLNPGVIPKVRKLLNSNDFYREAHQHIAGALFQLKGKSTFLTIEGNLKSKGFLDEAGGLDYLTALVQNISTSAGVEHHCQIVKNLSVRRQIISQCSVAIDRAHNMTIPISETLSEHKGAIRGMKEGQGKDYLENAEQIKSGFNDIKERFEKGDFFVGIKTGIANIDTYMQGLEPKTTTYLIARPHVGKSALALNISENVAQSNQGKVVFFTLESNVNALTRRRYAAHSKVFLTRLRTGNLDDGHWRDLIESASHLSKSNMIIVDKPRYKKVENLVALTESLSMESPLSLVVIDHIQRMRSHKKFNNRHLELSYISEELSTLAHECNVPILVLSQLNRAVENRRDQRPRLFDMKESGDLEQNADTVIGLYREDQESEFMEIDCLKGRDTGTWKTYLSFDRYSQKITDWKEPIENNEYHRGYGTL